MPPIDKRQRTWPLSRPRLHSLDSTLPVTPSLFYCVQILSSKSSTMASPAGLLLLISALHFSGSRSNVYNSMCLGLLHLFELFLVICFFFIFFKFLIIAQLAIWWFSYIASFLLVTFYVVPNLQS